MKRFYLIVISTIILIIFMCSCNSSDVTDTQSFITGSTGAEPTNPIIPSYDVPPSTSVLMSDPTIPSSSACLIHYLDCDPGSYQFTFKSDRYYEQMTYWLLVPENAQHEMPLIIFLHGLGELGKISEMENFGMIEMAREIYGESYPFIALNPCLPSHDWTYGNYPALLKELIDYICMEYSIDPDKIILTGHSLGSIGTWHMLSLYGDYFSCAVPVSCGYDGFLNYDNLAKVPILAFAGDGDEHELGYQVGMNYIISYINQFGGCAELKILEGQHHGMTKTGAYSTEVFEWMLSQ